jgi:hypothetical protein
MQPEILCAEELQESMCTITNIVRKTTRLTHVCRCARQVGEKHSVADDAIRQAEEASTRAQALEAAHKALADEAGFSTSFHFVICSSALVIQWIELTSVPQWDSSKNAIAKWKPQQ